MRVRIKFSKNGVMRYVGHLDLMRYFQKAMRRAGIDVAYSEGYSPHQIMSFAAPLGLGLTSDGEYMDVEVGGRYSCEEMTDRLNAVMADGMEIISCTALKDGAKKAMAAVGAADYIVYFKHHEDMTQQEISEGIQSYYTDREIISVIKQGKKSERTVDLKPLIYAFAPYTDDQPAPGLTGNDSSQAADCNPLNAVSGSECRKGYFLRLSTGSTDNIKPELVLEDFYRFLGLTYDPFNLQIHRTEIYKKSSEDFVPLCDFLA